MFIEEFNQKVRAIDEIVECFLTGGVFDFSLKVIVQDLDLEKHNNFASKKLATIPNVVIIRCILFVGFGLMAQETIEVLNKTN